MPTVKRTIRLDKSLSRDHYIADALIIRCIDCRFKRCLTDLESELKLKFVDTIIVAGGAKNISAPENHSDKDFIFSQIEKSIKLHHTKRIFIESHDECGAYGGAKKEKVLSDLLRAKEMVQKFKPVAEKDIPVDALFVDFNSINFMDKD